MNRVNYQKELDKVLANITKQRQEVGEAFEAPTLFLHSCCAPCSSYVLEYLAPYFRITVFYYNPNISADGEYRHRVAEQIRLIEAYNREGKGYPISILEGDYRPADFYQAVKGFEACPEGGERCFRCYELRLRETYQQAKKREMDYFGTTLTISPLKNAEKLNDIGLELQESGKKFHEVEAGLQENVTEGPSRVVWLPSDFKKKGGYQRSVELSGVYELYRQDFCGCSFSKAERENQKKLAEMD